jgi:3-hydroxyisobutyrate dehydrogenase
MHVAFLGLGAMGAPMAAHLARRGPLTVWNRTAVRAAAFAAQHGATAAATPREAGVADVVITCLGTSADVASLLDGPDGLVAGLRPGALLLDCTSGDPAGSRRIAERLSAIGVSFADAPVSGGTNGAEAGTLTIMVGADPQTFARARPVLTAFGRRIEHVGPIGAGDALKAVNNALLALNILAMAEGAVALARAGVAPRVALDVINASSGRSFVSEVLVPERVLTGRWPRSFRLALLDKDVAIATDLLDQLAVEGPLLALTGRLLRSAHGELGEEADYLDPIRLSEQRYGVELRG